MRSSFSSSLTELQIGMPEVRIENSLVDDETVWMLSKHPLEVLRLNSVFGRASTQNELGASSTRMLASIPTLTSLNLGRHFL